ncbi:efflux RND transporter periplasmic adaptor subunit [Bremerella cremea]|uniref:efflux RND transporter periplasmic adaptor subunit n=1 Tax=Bremerella cremea TaxID=1031537 RepID=UPI0013149F1C|nr:efflux RND transporter periplasmic adaptor subunit [Bremerella cremea]
MQHSDAPRTADEARRQIESLLDELADLSEMPLAPEEFYPQLLDRLTFATSALGAAVWESGPSGHLMLSQRTDLAAIYPTPVAAEAIAEDAAQLMGMLAQGEPDRRPGSGVTVLDYELNGVPLRAAGQFWGMLVLYQPLNLPKSILQSDERIARAFAEVAQHFQQQTLLRDFQQHRHDWKRQLDFAERVHADLSFPKTTYRIANEARNCLDVDRVTVLSWQGVHCHVEAVSGVDKPNHRSNIVGKLQRLSEAVVRARQTLLYTGETENLPPQVEAALIDYLDETPSKIIAIVPLRECLANENDEGTKPQPPEPLGALVLESIEQLDGHQLLRRAEPIVRHATTALANAQSYRHLPFAFLLAPLGKVLANVGWYRLSSTMKVVIPLALIVTAMFLIPTDFFIEVHGQLVPAVQRNVFAPSDGYVDEVLVQHGQHVAAGETLIQLQSNEFTLQKAEIVGQLQTAQAELDAIVVKRSQGMRRDPRADSRGAESYDDLSADEQRLNTMIESLTLQRNLLQKREDALTLKSPIAGQVLDWEVDEILTMRPVARGELLMKVADVDGPWTLRLELPDKRTYHVLAAQEASAEPLPVRFQLVNEPGKSYTGQLTNTAAIVDLDEDTDEPFVPLEATFNKAEIPHMRHGLSVVGRIECGRRSLAYVWTYQLVETVRRYCFW